VKPASVDLRPNNTANDVWTNTAYGRKPNRAIVRGERKGYDPPRPPVFQGDQSDLPGMLDIDIDIDIDLVACRLCEHRYAP
jgi:hypothetical protein